MSDQEHDFWDVCVRKASPDRDLEGAPVVCLQFQYIEDLIAEGLTLSRDDLEYLLELCK